MKSGSHSDLGQGDAQQYESQHIEQTPENGCFAWMACDDCSTRCKNGGMHEPGLNRVIDPLANPNEHYPQAQQQSMRVGNAFDFKGQTGNCSRCSKCNKEVVPVLDLEPGARFIPHLSTREVHCDSDTRGGEKHV